MLIYRVTMSAAYDDLTTIIQEDEGEEKRSQRFDPQVYMDRMKGLSTKCCYCSKKDLYENGVLSMSARQTSNKFESPYWFCCECCSNMYKHEVGIMLMPHDLFVHTLKKGYKGMYKKRYSV